jgi:hypothetical protein
MVSISERFTLKDKNNLKNLAKSLKYNDNDNDNDGIIAKHILNNEFSKITQPQLEILANYYRNNNFNDEKDTNLVLYKLLKMRQVNGLAKKYIRKKNQKKTIRKKLSKRKKQNTRKYKRKINKTRRI